MIGIFGDSYGEEVNTTAGGYLEGWPSILGRMYDEEIENFCQCSTSISYSYQKFCEQDLSKYSKVIFIITFPTRQLLINNAEQKSIHFQGGKKQSIWNNNLLGRKLNKEDIRVLEYQEYISAIYPDTWNFLKRAIGKDVLHSHKNTLILDAHHLSNIGTLGLNSPMAPWFTSPKGKFWGDTYLESGELGRVCHCSSQQNIELAEHIKNYFENGFDSNNAIEKESNKNFTTPKSLEDAGLVLRKQPFNYE